MSHTVGELARLAGVTVRTLHHYDRIGLLTPSGRTSAGYRVYEVPDVDRLQRVLLYRGLGFGLEEIGALLDDPDVDAGEHLRRQHRLLTAQLDRTHQMVAAVEKEMEARQMGISLTPEERFEVFGDWLPEQYADEAEAVTAALEAANETVFTIGSIETGAHGCTVRGSAGTWSARTDWTATHG